MKTRWPFLLALSPLLIMRSHAIELGPPGVEVRIGTRSSTGTGHGPAFRPKTRSLPLGRGPDHLLPIEFDEQLAEHAWDAYFHLQEAEYHLRYLQDGRNDDLRVSLLAAERRLEESSSLDRRLRRPGEELAAAQEWLLRGWIELAMTWHRGLIYRIGAGLSPGQGPSSVIHEGVEQVAPWVHPRDVGEGLSARSKEEVLRFSAQLERHGMKALGEVWTRIRATGKQRFQDLGPGPTSETERYLVQAVAARNAIDVLAASGAGLEISEGARRLDFFLRPLQGHFTELLRHMERHPAVSPPASPSIRLGAYLSPPSSGLLGMDP